ncbi:MAG: L,D-transpeptidase [Candidatus Cloacimonetes bacterium]|nr:L,D-transpeptidase [Candidatus Cloacimonadota bacterium]
MPYRGLRHLRNRKNQGTSCLIVILSAVLIALLAFYGSQIRKDKVHLAKPVKAPAQDSAKVTAPKALVKVVPTIPDNVTRKAPDPARTKQARMVEKGDYLLIEKSRHLLHHYRDGVLQASYTVALGKNPGDKSKEGDNATPEGHFEVNFIKDSSDWTHDFGDGKGAIKGAYGPFFIALYTGAKGTFSANTWRGIGIHGTHNPASIGTNASEGCIRLHNAELLKLKAAIENKPSVPVDIIK